MANLKISQLTDATTPLAGTETVPVVQGGVTKKVTVANLTTGRAVDLGSNCTVSTPYSFGGLNYGFASTSSGNPNAYSSNFFGSNEQECAGYYSGGGQWKSESATYSAVSIGQGVVEIYANTGLTPGGIFARKKVASFTAGGVYLPFQAPTASAPTYVKGGVYFDNTLNKLRIGGATGWETVTSI
jgi:hypothetical protein